MLFGPVMQSTRQGRRLKLSRETVRVLGAEQLRRAAGGSVYSAAGTCNCATQQDCTTTCDPTPETETCQETRRGASFSNLRSCFC